MEEGHGKILSISRAGPTRTRYAPTTLVKTSANKFFHRRMLYSRSTTLRPSDPIIRRRLGSLASFPTASAHSLGVEARNPVRPCWIIFRFMPTGLPITGRPAAMYWSTFSPHLPRLHESSGKTLIPMSAEASSFASVDSAQGRK